MTLKQIAEIIEKGHRIAILPHTSPDGDCLGASFALSAALKKEKKDSIVILEEEIPRTYSFLSGEYVKMSEALSNAVYDLVICLDCGDERRLNQRLNIFNDCELTVNIDHHISNTHFARYNYVDSNSAATGEIIFDLLRELDISIDKGIAECLYTAISTDTGGFRYSNTTSRTHSIASILLGKGIDVAEINRKVFDTFSLERLSLTAKAINLIEMYQEGKIAVIALDYSLLNLQKINTDEMEGLSGIPRSIEGVEVGIVFTEKEPGQVKVSFRSNQYVDVSKIAVSFGGGGHNRASGCTVGMDIRQVKKRVLDAVAQALLRGVDQ
ncbi:MAG: bifunctional oligoribonuclease/PAP phosphatase NrnA [Clostridia bacterium]